MFGLPLRQSNQRIRSAFQSVYNNTTNLLEPTVVLIPEKGKTCSRNFKRKTSGTDEKLRIQINVLNNRPPMKTKLLGI